MFVTILYRQTCLQMYCIPRRKRRPMLTLVDPVRARA